VSTWQDLVTASLIGTERAVVPALRIPGLPAGAEPAAEDPAAILLDRAAMATAARRAGRTADRAEPLPAAEPDGRPAVSPAASGRLVRMLSGEHPDLLTEWLTAVAARGLRPPAHSLPALLDRARRAAAADPGLRRLVTEAGGPLARWLAALNPDWKFAAQDPGPGLTGDDAWRLGDAGQRRGYLAALRARDRDAARELVAARWDAASAGERVMFLSVLADAAGPDPADEPLLEAALDDRAEDVHGWAAYLLTQLPGSALGRRMASRARRCLHLRQGLRGPYLVTDPPGECDAAMRRDGITPGPGAGRAQLADRTRLMLEVVARTPLRTWTDTFAMRPAEIVAVRSGDWAPVLIAGWSRAAIAQRDQEWMAALINEALTGRPPPPTRLPIPPSLSPFPPAAYGALSQLARRADPALGAPGARPDPLPGAPPTVRDAITVLRFRYDMLKELNDDHSGG
jgi:Family of unknown function (DUF5691)